MMMQYDSKDLGLICLVNKRKIRFQILSDLRIPSWIFLKKRTLRDSPFQRFPLLEVSEISHFRDSPF